MKYKNIAGKVIRSKNLSSFLKLDNEGHPFDDSYTIPTEGSLTPHKDIASKINQKGSTNQSIALVQNAAVNSNDNGKAQIEEIKIVKENEEQWEDYNDLKFSNNEQDELEETIHSDIVNIESIIEWSNSFWNSCVFNEND